MPDNPERYFISSAVITVMPDRVNAVLPQIEAMEGVEVHGHENGRAIVVIEGESTRQLGDRLTAINLIEGVLAANMVFEHAEEPESTRP